MPQSYIRTVVGPPGRDGKRRWSLICHDTVIAFGKARTWRECQVAAREAKGQYWDGSGNLTTDPVKLVTNVLKIVSKSGGVIQPWEK